MQAAEALARTRIRHGRAIGDSTFWNPVDWCDGMIRQGIAGFFGRSAHALLIVVRLFIIHPVNGEVAEWSKALPC